MKTKDIALSLNKELLQDPLIKEYQYYEGLINNNESLSLLEDKLKTLQKELLEKKALNEDITYLEEEYHKQKEYFDTHPILVNYTYLKEEVNNLLIEIETLINTALNDDRE